MDTEEKIDLTQTKKITFGYEDTLQNYYFFAQNNGFTKELETEEDVAEMMEFIRQLGHKQIFDFLSRPILVFVDKQFNEAKEAKSQEYLAQLEERLISEVE